jgi:hypothetical protein
MKSLLFGILLVTVVFVPFLAADTSKDLVGKWSGNWTPQGGIPDAMTIEFTGQLSGVLMGKILTPVPMEFTRASFDPKTGNVVLEAMDENSGKHYRIDGKIHGTELKGTLGIDGVKGDLLLIKWTYFPR